MLIYCEKCDAQYRIDPGRITDESVRAICNKCGAAIELSKFMEKIPSPDEDDPDVEEVAVKKAVYNDKIIDNGWLKSVSFTSRMSFRIVFPFILLVITIGAGMALMYLDMVPELVERQISLRAQFISRSLSTGILQPLMLKNYLMINKTAEMYADFPDVAYVAVINPKGAVVAGIINKKDGFTQDFRDKIEKDGFPSDILPDHKFTVASDDIALTDITAGGRKMHNAAVRIPDSLGVVHAGIFMEEAEKEVLKTLWPLLGMLAGLAVFGSIILILISRSIIIPIGHLARAAQKIALGDISHPISIHGKGEIEALSTSLEMMRQAINSAIVRLRRKNNS